MNVCVPAVSIESKQCGDMFVNSINYNKHSNLSLEFCDTLNWADSRFANS